MAPSAHGVTHRPQPVQSSSSILTMLQRPWRCPFGRRAGRGRGINTVGAVLTVAAEWRVHIDLRQGLGGDRRRWRREGDGPGGGAAGRRGTMRVFCGAAPLHVAPAAREHLHRLLDAARARLPTGAPAGSSRCTRAGGTAAAPRRPRPPRGRRPARSAGRRHHELGTAGERCTFGALLRSVATPAGERCTFGAPLRSVAASAGERCTFGAPLRKRRCVGFHGLTPAPGGAAPRDPGSR